MGCLGSNGLKVLYRLHAVTGQASVLVHACVNEPKGPYPPLVSASIRPQRVSEGVFSNRGVTLATQRSWRLEVQLSTFDTSVPERSTASKAASLIAPFISFLRPTCDQRRPSLLPQNEPRALDDFKCALNISILSSALRLGLCGGFNNSETETSQIDAQCGKRRRRAKRPLLRRFRRRSRFASPRAESPRRRA
ncbi:hypothetical protein BCR35DRAFT_94454 [Leucosporidium creatinivorum]|uniref:Uncharacterized protein n=1 Tax=Leucosporidium creatinivorum TaxID=106004 RepID=A0A1Y2F780_9BASI|nr:hypothetical protein BCR35DRAFT_94454 [Leucosporidium creatinivorum]